MTHDPPGPPAVPPPPPDPLAGATPEQLALLGPLLTQLRAQGLPVPPALEQRVPEVFVGTGARNVQIAQGMAEACRGENLFLMGEEIVTIDELRGRTVPMPSLRFSSWADHVATFWSTNRTGARVVTSMGERMAGMVLRCDDFRQSLRPLNGINMVKQPALKDGRPHLLQQGYDLHTGMFTVRGGLDYDETMTLQEARNLLLNMLMDFPFDSGRSLAVQIAVMVTMYVKVILDAQACKIPTLCYNANLVGSGKTLLGKLALSPLYGDVDISPPMIGKEHEQTLKNELDSVALGCTPYLFMDNVRGKVASQQLEAFVTAPSWSGRLYHTQNRFKVPLRCVTILSGNEMTFNPDMARRTISCDLWAQQTSAERPAPAIEMTDQWLADEQNRSRILSALWAMVSYALTPDAEGHTPADRAEIGKPLASFEGWSRLVAGIVVACGFDNPLAPSLSITSGDLEEDDVVVLIEEALRAAKLAPGHTARITCNQLVPLAREKNLLGYMIGTVQDVIAILDARRDGWKEEEFPDHGELSGTTLRKPVTEAEKFGQATQFCDPQKHLSPLSRAVRKRISRLFTVDGAQYQFGVREEARHSTFTMRRIS